MKNIIFGTGIVVTLTTLVFVLVGQLELSTFGVINTTVLSILYGWYQKLIKDDVIESNNALMDIVEEVIKNTSKEITLMECQLIETEKLRDQELKAYQSTVNNLRLKLDNTTEILPELQKVVEDVVEADKPKRKRNTKK
jgi:hypothetical protein